MQYIRLLDIDETLVNDLWKKVETAGGFYSIADGVTKDTFRQALYASNIVIEFPGGFARVSVKPEYAELHPVILSYQAYRNAENVLRELYIVGSGIFQNKPIRCIIPIEMRGLKRLAEVLKMQAKGLCLRSLSGIDVTCAIYEWRP